MKSSLWKLHKCMKESKTKIVHVNIQCRTIPFKLVSSYADCGTWFCVSTAFIFIHTKKPGGFCIKISTFFTFPENKNVMTFKPCSLASFYNFFQYFTFNIIVLTLLFVLKKRTNNSVGSPKRQFSIKFWSCQLHFLYHHIPQKCNFQVYLYSLLLSSFSPCPIHT